MQIDQLWPALSDKITTAREAGYSDDEIKGFVHGKIKQARQSGYSATEVIDYLRKKPLLTRAKDVVSSGLQQVGEMALGAYQSLDPTSHQSALGAAAAPVLAPLAATPPAIAGEFASGAALEGLSQMGASPKAAAAGSVAADFLTAGPGGALGLKLVRGAKPPMPVPKGPAPKMLEPPPGWTPGSVAGEGFTMRPKGEQDIATEIAGLEQRNAALQKTIAAEKAAQAGPTKLTGKQPPPQPKGAAPQPPPAQVKVPTGPAPGPHAEALRQRVLARQGQQAPAKIGPAEEFAQSLAGKTDDQLREMHKQYKPGSLQQGAIQAEQKTRTAKVHPEISKQAIQEEIEDAKMILRDPNSGVVTREAAKEVLIRNGITDIPEPPKELGFPELRRSYENIPQSFDPLQKNYQTPTGPQKLVRRGDIIRDLQKELDLPIRTGFFPFVQRRARGAFKRPEEVVRLKLANDVDVATHEVGHFFSKKFLPGVSRRAAAHPELVQLGQQLYGARVPAGGYAEEGLADFVRLYVTNPQTAQQAAPQFFQFFEQSLQNGFPRALETLRQAQTKYARYQAQPAIAKVASQISVGEKAKSALSFSDAYTATLDDLNPIKIITDRMARGQPLDVSKDPYKLARLFRGWIGKADLFLTKGTRDFRTLQQTGEGLSDILKPVENDLDGLRSYLVARRSMELNQRGIQSGIDPNDAAATVQTLHQQFGPTAQRLYSYQDRVLNYLKDGGFLDNAGYAAIKRLNDSYVPFYRLMEDIEEGLGGTGKTFANLYKPTHKIKGSGKEILDPLESIIKNTYSFINLAERNRVARALTNLADVSEGSGKFVEKITKPSQGIQFNLKEVQKKIRDTLNQSGIQLPTNDPQLLDQLATIFRPAQNVPGGKNIISVWQNGKTDWYQIHPALYKSMMALDGESSNLLTRLLSFPARSLRLGATVLSPEFSIRNPLRDQWTATIFSKYGYRPGIDFVKGVFHMLKQDEMFDAWKAAGGEHSMLLSLDRAHLQRQLKDILTGGTVKHVWRHPIDSLRILSELGEAGTRLGEFSRGIAKEGMTTEGMMRAAFASREVTLDFSRRGAKMGALNQITAFLNANLQGLDKTARAFKESPVGTLTRTGVGITLPSVLLYMANRDDPRYQEQPGWQKYLFWIIPTGEMDTKRWNTMTAEEKAEFSSNHPIWRIPKPFELGLLFGSSVERIMEYVDSKDPQGLKDLGNNVMNSLPNPLPTAFVPLIENFANYSMFRERPLVPRGKEMAEAKYQSGSYTTETAKWLGDKLNYPPNKIENLAQGYFGGAGKLTMEQIDRLAFRGQMKEKPSAGGISDVPGVRGLIANFPGQPESIERFYDEYARVSEAKSTFDLLRRQRNFTELQQYHVKHAEDLRRELLMRPVAKSMSLLRKQQESIIENRHYSPEEKRKKLDAVTFEMARIASQAMKAQRQKNQFSHAEVVP